MQREKTTKRIGGHYARDWLEEDSKFWGPRGKDQEKSKFKNEEGTGKEKTSPKRPSEEGIRNLWEQKG